MAHHIPFQVMGFHSCDKEVGLKILNGNDHLKPSNNPWDWLGHGIYFWEQNPERALEYAIGCATKTQFNKVPIKTPFVLGAIIELGNCLNLIEPESLSVLKEAYKGLEKICKEAGVPLPKNKGANRALDAAVFKHLHRSRAENELPNFDSIRCAFIEGEPIYPTANFTSRLHIELCIINPEQIKGYFIPHPLDKFNPYLHKDFHTENKRK